MATANPRAPAIGIDLGTTNSCVAVYSDGEVKILSNEQGQNTTPSVVAFTPEGRKYGEAARKYAHVFPEHCVDNIKRIIGRDLKEPSVWEDAKHLPFPVVSSRGKIEIEIQEKSGTKYTTPEEISAMILKQMKDIAERHLDVAVTDAVITVPAYFTDSQRRATHDAAKIAGLNVLQILNEPTAAALAYGFDNLSDGKVHKLFVYDLGGGTFDVSILLVEDGEFVVEATDGDTHLGGVDIDNLMVRHMVREFRRTTGFDLQQDKKAIRRLKTACEKAKIELSSEVKSKIDLLALRNDEDFTYPITREWLEDVCEGMLLKTKGIVGSALERKRIDRASITDIILVGGSTRMPMVQNLIKEIFSGKEALTNINPDEAVAYGAAIQAALLTGTKVRNVHLRDVTPLTLGFAVRGGLMAPLIKRNTPIPKEETKTVTTSQDNQEFLTIEIFEGERRLVKDNALLGAFTLMGIPPVPRGIPKIPITFKVDKDGILHASAYDPASDRKTMLTLANRSNLSPGDLLHAIQQAADMDRQDRLLVRKISSKNTLLEYVAKIRESIKNSKIRERIEVKQLANVEDMLETASDMALRESDLCSIVDYENCQNELEEIWKPIGMSLYQHPVPGEDDASRPAFSDDTFVEALESSIWESQWTDLGSENPVVELDI